MGNENSDNKKKKDNLENKKEFILTNNFIIDIIIFYNYEKKFESISNQTLTNNKFNKNKAYIICVLINGFIEIYNIYNDNFKLTLSFEAHRDIISKIIQLKKDGLLLTSSYDNSLKIFKLNENCNKYALIYKFNLNIIFIRINDVIEMSYNNNIIISVMNHLINFPINKNILSENKNNLSDYYFSKFEHQKKYLNNLLEISKDILIALDEIDNKLLCFKLNYTEELSENIVLIKIVDLNSSKEINENDCRNNYKSKKFIECLTPKYNCILLSDGFFIKVIDINYLEIVSIFQIKLDNCPFIMSLNTNFNKILLFDTNKIFQYKINNKYCRFEIEKENEKIINIDYLGNLNELPKIIYSPFNPNHIFTFYKKMLIKIDINNL